MPNAIDSVTKSPLTLVEFGKSIDAYLGRCSHFAEAVVELADVRVEIAAIEARRKAVRELLNAHYERDDRMLNGGVEPVILRRTKSTTTTKRTVRATEVRKKMPAVWQACRVPKPKVKVTAPFPAAAKTALPGVTDGRKLAVTLRLWESLPQVTELREREAVLKVQLCDIVEATSWDGLPYLFADKWGAQTKALEFDAATMAARYPTEFNAMAVDVVSERSGYIIVGTPYSNELEDDAE